MKTIDRRRLDRWGRMALEWHRAYRPADHARMTADGTLQGWLEAKQEEVADAIDTIRDSLATVAAREGTPDDFLENLQLQNQLQSQAEELAISEHFPV